MLVRWMYAETQARLVLEINVFEMFSAWESMYLEMLFQEKYRNPSEMIGLHQLSYKVFCRIGQRDSE